MMMLSYNIKPCSCFSWSFLELFVPFVYRFSAAILGLLHAVLHGAPSPCGAPTQDASEALGAWAVDGTNRLRHHRAKPSATGLRPRQGVLSILLVVFSVFVFMLFLFVFWFWFGICVFILAGAGGQKSKGSGPANASTFTPICVFSFWAMLSRWWTWTSTRRRSRTTRESGLITKPNFSTLNEYFIFVTM